MGSAAAGGLGAQDAEGTQGGEAACMAGGEAGGASVRLEDGPAGRQVAPQPPRGPPLQGASPNNAHSRSLLQGLWNRPLPAR